MSTGPTFVREALHRLAIHRLLEGYAPEEVAEFLEVGRASVYRWQAAYRRWGDAGLAIRPRSGRPPKLTGPQAAEVLAWLDQDARHWHFSTPRWTAPRLASLVAQRWNIHLHPHSLNRWLTQRRITPQIPEPAARERDPEQIDRWVHEEFPAIKKTPTTAEPGCFRPMNAAF